MSNIFWGWGREDDELFLRFKEHKLTVGFLLMVWFLHANEDSCFLCSQLYRQTGLTTGYDTFKHIHNKERRPRDYNRYGEQKKASF